MIMSVPTPGAENEKGEEPDSDAVVGPLAHEVDDETDAMLEALRREVAPYPEHVYRLIREGDDLDDEV